MLTETLGKVWEHGKALTQHPLGVVVVLLFALIYWQQSKRDEQIAKSHDDLIKILAQQDERHRESLKTLWQNHAAQAAGLTVIGNMLARIEATLRIPPDQRAGLPKPEAPRPVEVHKPKDGEGE